MSTPKGTKPLIRQMRWEIDRLKNLNVEMYEALINLLASEDGRRHCSDPSCFDCQSYRQARAALAKAGQQ